MKPFSPSPERRALMDISEVLVVLYFLVWARLHHGAAAALLLGCVWVVAFVDLMARVVSMRDKVLQAVRLVCTYRTPATGYHKIFGLFIGECNQTTFTHTTVSISRVSSPPFPAKSNVLHRGLRHGYSPSVEVFLQSLVQLGEPSKLQLCHGLLLALAVVVGADLVG